MERGVFMSRKIDLSGQRFGKLVVLSESEKIGEKVHWLCKCDCGNMINVSTSHLRKGNKVSCGLCEHDFIGKRFGRLYVESISKREKMKSGSVKIYFHCKCDCGNETDVVYQQLKSGKTKSCGCYRRDKLTHDNITHNQSKTRLYKIYIGMKKRCYNEKSDSYSYYGGRGITICDEWLNSFETFKKWSMDNGYSENKSIDRINVDIGYCPNNCRWTDLLTQANNKSDNTYLEFNGERMTIAEWGRKTGISCYTISKRIRSGWSIEDALTKSKQKNQFG